MTIVLIFLDRSPDGPSAKSIRIESASLCFKESIWSLNAQSFSHDDQNLIIFVQVLLIVIHQQPTMDAITLHMNQFYCLHAIRRVYISPQRLYPWLWLGTGIHAPKPVGWSSDQKKILKETPKISHQLAPSGPQTRCCEDPWLGIFWISR